MPEHNTHVHTQVTPYSQFCCCLLQEGMKYNARMTMESPRVVTERATELRELTHQANCHLNLVHLSFRETLDVA